MKIGNRLESKLGHRSLSVAITVGVVVVVLLLNVAASALCLGQRWYIDLTPDTLYTLTDDAHRMLGEAIDSANATRPKGSPVEVDIVFCADPDVLCKNDMMRYVYYTALDMQKAYPDTIKVSTRDVWSNPSSVDEFRASAHSSIYASNVIIASGSEFRIYNINSFFVYDSTLDNQIWAYNGEKIFIKGITAVTRAEAPICAVTTNHGEPFATEAGRAEYSEFLSVLEAAGYEVRFLNLAEEDIPENCRLIVTMDPQTDFLTDFYGGDVDELDKLDAFLQQAYSFMVFVDADTPKLSVLEEYLEMWGIALDRTSVDGTRYNYQIADPGNKVDGEGFSMVGQYEIGGLGGVLTESMRENGGSPKVLFQNAISIGYSSSYDMSYQLADSSSGTPGYTFGSYYKNGKTRSIFDIFRTGETALAYAKDPTTGALLTEDGEAWIEAFDPRDPFRLMTVSRQMITVSEGHEGSNDYLNSYVCAVGSTEFAKNAVLSSNAYGNTDVLLETLRVIGREVELVGLPIKPFYNSEMNANYYNIETAPTRWTVVLVLLPAVGFLCSGCWVLVRRRLRT